MKNRVPHFTHGNEKSDFKSITKKQFVAHDLSSVQDSYNER